MPTGPCVTCQTTLSRIGFCPFSLLVLALLQDPGELAGFILKYMQTLYSYIEQCPASQNPQPACKAFANLPANVRQMMLDEYSELMLSYNITQRQDAVQELIWQIQVPVQRLAVDVSMGGATLSSM